jgi:ribulose-5-phosphate 4-epimerase/fuculose-1-phosphate aldolase
MTGTTKVQSWGVAGACNEAEWKTRVELAALYRVLDLYGMSDLANQEVGARVEQQPDHYLVHAYGAFYDEVTASSLVKVDAQGKAADADAPWLNDGGVNLAKWIFGARPDVSYFVHGHCEDVMAVASIESKLLPLSQPAVYLGHMLTYLEYEFDEDESFGQRFQEAFGQNNIMISHNHGYYCLGRSAAEAFFRAYYLRQACAVQLKVMASGDKPHLIDPQRVARYQDQMYQSADYNYDGTTEWAGLLRRLDRLAPDYKE